MRSGASYNYLLVNGERRLTEREILRLQGFPDKFKIVRYIDTNKTQWTEPAHIVIVCRDIDASIIETIISQISWGNRVRGIIKESELIEWYELCLRVFFPHVKM